MKSRGSVPGAFGVGIGCRTAGRHTELKRGERRTRKRTIATRSQAVYRLCVEPVVAAYWSGAGVSPQLLTCISLDVS